MELYFISTIFGPVQNHTSPGRVRQKRASKEVLGNISYSGKTINRYPLSLGRIRDMFRVLSYALARLWNCVSQSARFQAVRPAEPRPGTVYV
jgi:hypothetical protein